MILGPIEVVPGTLDLVSPAVCAGLQLAVSRGNLNRWASLLRVGGVPAEVLRSRLTASGVTVTVIEPSYIIGRQGNCLIMSIKGTSTGIQWVYHLGGTWGREYPYGPAGQNCTAHAAMLHVSEAYYNDLIPFLTAIPSINRIVITGHSYGAGLATLIAIKLAHNGHARKTELCVFGSPRVLSGGLLVGLPDTYARIQHEGDGVTSLPPPFASARMLIGTAGQAFFSKFKVGWLLSKIGGKAVEAPFSTGWWKHYGTGWQLKKDGRLRKAMPPEESADPELGTSRPWGMSGGITLNANTPRNHYMDTAYWPALKARLQRAGPLSADLLGLIFEIDELAAMGEEPYAADNFEALAPNWSALVRESYWPKISGAGIESMLGAEGAALIPLGARVGPSIIREEGFTGMASGTWKFTAWLRNGKYGRSVSQHWQGTADFAGAIAKCKEWIGMLAGLIGNARTTVFGPGEAISFYGSPGTPIFNYARVADAKKPRESVILGPLGLLGVGWFSASGVNGADTIQNALSFPLYGQYQPGDPSTAVRAHDNLTLLCPPDRVLLYDRYDAACLIGPDGGGYVVDDAIRELVQALTKVGSGYGLMAKDPAVKEYPIDQWILDSTGRVGLQVTDHDYESGDWVKIKQSGSPKFNKTFRIFVEEDSGLIVLKNIRATPEELPREGLVYRTRKADGTRLQQFYGYLPPPGGIVTPYPVRITKRNPGRPFDPLAQRRRARIRLD